MFSTKYCFGILGGFLQSMMDRRSIVNLEFAMLLLLGYGYTMQLIGPISYLGACYIRTKATKCIREKMTFAGEPLNHIHQDTKSSRLIAVWKRSFIKIIAYLGLTGIQSKCALIVFLKKLAGCSLK